MRDAHVLDILESDSFSSLGESELAAVRTHAAVCPDCARAYRAARVSHLLLKERSAETIEPPPFFQTRVLQALRERRSANEIWSFGRLWKVSGALVSSMAVAVVLLASLTLLAPATQTTDASQELASSSNSYTAETLVLAPDELVGEELTDAQVLTTIYASGEDESR